jgi:hypothetical protein
MMRLRRVHLLLLFAIVALPRVLAAQTQTKNRIWAGGGVAVGARSNEVSGLGLMGQVVFQRDLHQVSLRGLFLGDVVTEAGLMYGKARETSWGQVSFSSGLSWLSFDVCARPAEVFPLDAGVGSNVRELRADVVQDYPCNAVGIPVVADATLSGRVLGLGIQALANINPKAPYAGISLFLQVGWLP